MRARLSYKIFGAFLLTSLVIVCSTVGALRFFGYRNFVNYLSKVEVEKLEDLSEMVTEEYETEGGWDRLRQNPGLWRNMVAKAGHREIDVSEQFSEKPGGRDGEHVGPEGHDGARSRRSHRRKDFFLIGRRIFLLDAHRQPVAGRAGKPDEVTLKEIAVEGKTIGWLGIRKMKPRLKPLEAGFLKRQDELLAFIGVGILLLTALVAFFLSKHLLAPIRILTEGTKALASRKFTTRLDVRSGDEIGQLAADFNAMAQTLEQYESMRKQWISDISHELRTPLSILKGEIEAVQDGVRTMSQMALDSLHAEVCHIAKIVDDLHQLSMADTGKLHLDRNPVDPLQVLNDVVSLFRLRFEQAQIAMRVRIEPGRKLSVLGDDNRLRQLFSNILENTLRYADSPGSLGIRHEVSDTRIVLHFEDSGPGVPEEAVDKLFDRLYRVDSARSRSTGGSGLGLALCKTIVESHGGSISAHNAPNGGLGIRIELPLAPT